MFFSHITQTPQEGLFETYMRYLKDPNPDKVNLSVGMYYNTDGSVKSLEVVKEAELLLAKEARSRGYLSIHGDAKFTEAYSRLLLSDALYEKRQNHLATFQSVGATGALYLMGSLLKEALVEDIYLSQPTWANHKHIFHELGLKLQYYPYLDKETKLFLHEEFCEKLRSIPKGSTVLLQACCHNPTGADPTQEQWKELLDIVIAQGHLPLIDFAYQGFAEGIDEDAFVLRYLAEKGAEFIACASCSKNFGLYAERVGLLMVHVDNAQERDLVFAKLKYLIRGCYSNPPAHGPWVVEKILNDTKLKSEWIKEVSVLRATLHHNRDLLADALNQALPDRDYSFIKKHQGMFSLLGVNREQVEQLEAMGFYLAPSGRINVAGVADANLCRFAEALRKVIYKK